MSKPAISDLLTRSLIAGFVLSFDGGSSWAKSAGDADFAAITDVPAFLNVVSSVKYLPDAKGILAPTVLNALPYRYGRDGRPLGIVPERARTNIALYSTSLSAGITLTNMTRIANAHRDPLGGNAFSGFVEDATNGLHGVLQSGMAVTGSASYTHSIYIRAGNRTQVRTGFYDGTTHAYAEVDLLTGALLASANATAVAIYYLGDGLYNVSVTAAVDAGATTASGYVYAIGGGSTTYAGTVGAIAFFAGCQQFEAGASPSSYIPTEGSPVVRSADVIKVDATKMNGYIDNDHAGIIFGSLIPEHSLHALAELFVVAQAKPAHVLRVHPSAGGRVQLISANAAFNATTSTMTTGTPEVRGAPLVVAGRYTAGRRMVSAKPEAIIDGTDTTVRAVPAIDGVGVTEFVIGRDSNANSTGAYVPVAKVGFLSHDISDSDFRTLLQI